MTDLKDIAVDLDSEVSRDTSSHNQAEKRFAMFEWFRKLTIGRKIQVVFYGNLAFALLAGLFVVVGYFQLADRAEAIAERHDHALAAEQLVVELSEAQRHAEMFIATGDERRSQAAIAELTSAREKTTTLRAMVTSSDVQAFDRLALIDEGMADFRRQIANVDASNGNSFRNESQASELQAVGGSVLESGRELAQLLEADADATSDAGSSYISTLLLVFVGLAAFLTMLTLIAQRYFNRNVGEAIADKTEQMTQLASGKKDVQITGQDRSDEIGAMARAMEIFHRAGLRLERMSRERAERAKAELEEQTKVQLAAEEARLERQRVIARVADQFERTIGDVVSGVAAASSELETTSRSMASTAEESSERTAEVSSSMEEANSGATAAAAASDEFAMSIGEISRQAASSAELARQATDAATEADATISQLSDSADQVGEIVELIQTIAQRTNLLALNASIEAARGGEAGRGFAVVASEVKELAMQTSRATEQVAEQIRSMQDRTGASVSALRSIAGQIQQLETTAVSIASAVDQQSVAGQDLARSIDLAARGTERVATHIVDVRELSLSTGAAARQVLDSATELDLQASSLREQVNGFLAEVRNS
jgi:methyl-accepting chemotaxis protein